MNITQCKKIARAMQAADYWGIDIVLQFPEMTYRIDCFNRAGMKRTVTSLSDWSELHRIESAR